MMYAMSQGYKNNLCVPTQRSFQCSSLSDLDLVGLGARDSRKMLRLAWTQNMQQSNHTEEAQEYAAPSTAGKNEVASLACRLGRRDKCTSRKPGQNEQQAQ